MKSKKTNNEWGKLMGKMPKIDKKWLNPKTGKKYGYYSRDGVGYEDVLEWASAFEPPKDAAEREKWFQEVKIVKQE